MIKDYAPWYKPAETVLKNRTAGTIGEKADRQFELAKDNAGDFGDKLIDAADSISETFGYSLLGPGALTYVLGTAEGLEEYRKQRESGIPQKVAFNRALAKTSAAVLLDKIGDYVAKNNRIDEKLYGKSKPEANTYGLQYGKNNIADDIYYPKTRREESAFNRSLANKTSELKEGEIKRIIIDTADNTYFIEANGYMSGEIKLVIPIDENTEWLRDHRRGFLDGNYEPREEDIIFIKSRGR